MLNPGDLDTTFGTGGKVTIDFEAKSVALQSDGKIILGGQVYNGSNHDFTLARYNTDGSLDTTFGTGGKVTTDFNGTSDFAVSVVLQSDGKIILGGQVFNGLFKFALARYNTDGSLDTTFGINGKVTTNFTGNNSDYARSVALQSDGKIILGGEASNGLYYNFALARYNTDGSLDTTFGTGGKVTDFNGANDSGRSVALQSDGKIILGGQFYNDSNYDFALARYNTDGSLDTTFGINGKVTTDFNGTSDFAVSVVLQSDGKIILGGQSWNGLNDDFALVRYNTDGSLDNTFGTGGKVTTDFGNYYDYTKSVVLQSDGKIIVLGDTTDDEDIFDFALARYNIDGSLDTTFGTGGKVTTDFNGNYDSANSAALQSDGKIILLGYSGNNWCLLRYIGNTSVLTPVVPICFLAGTPVLTDQGSIAIEKISINKNTIRGKKIVAITKTVTIEDKIVCIEKDALGTNIPSQKTFISRNHKLFFNKQMIKAKHLIGQVDGVYNKKYNGEVLYNVLLETHEKMMVNNLIVETLDPVNVIAQLYNGTLSVEERNDTIVNINYCANDYKKVYGKLK